MRNHNFEGFDFIEQHNINLSFTILDFSILKNVDLTNVDLSNTSLDNINSDDLIPENYSGPLMPYYDPNEQQQLYYIKSGIWSCYSYYY